MRVKFIQAIIDILRGKRKLNIICYPLESLKCLKILRNKSKEKIKLNLGCGSDVKENWINIDLSGKNISFKWNLLKKKLPFKNESVDYIFMEHVLEHFNFEEARNLIKKFIPILKTGGVLRINIPDLDNLFNVYNNFSKEQMINNTYFESAAEYVNTCFYLYGHKWMYNKEELIRLFENFKEVKTEICKLNESKHNELKNLEIRNESNWVIEVTKK